MCPPFLDIEGYSTNEFSMEADSDNIDYDTDETQEKNENSAAALDPKAAQALSEVILEYKGQGAFVYSSSLGPARAPQTFRNFTIITDDHVFIYSIGRAILLEKITPIGVCPIYIAGIDLEARHCDFTKCRCARSLAL